MRPARIQGFLHEFRMNSAVNSVVNSVSNSRINLGIIQDWIQGWIQTWVTLNEAASGAPHFQFIVANPASFRAEWGSLRPKWGWIRLRYNPFRAEFRHESGWMEGRKRVLYDFMFVYQQTYTLLYVCLSGLYLCLVYVCLAVFSFKMQTYTN